MLQTAGGLNRGHFVQRLLPEVLQEGLQLRPGHLDHVFARLGSRNLPGQIRARDQPATDHDVSGATYFPAASPVVNGPDFAVGNDRDLDHFLDTRDPFPVRWRFVAIDLGPSMDHNLLRTTIGQCPGAIESALRAFITQTHFRRHRDMRRHSAPYMVDDAVQQLRLFEQDRAATGTIDGLGRTTEVQVQHGGTQLTGIGCVFGQAHRIGTQQLQA